MPMKSTWSSSRFHPPWHAKAIYCWDSSNRNGDQGWHVDDHQLQSLGSARAGGRIRDHGSQTGRYFAALVMATFPLHLPDDLKEAVTAQEEAQGVSLNHYISTVLAARIGAQGEAAR
jgi:hypothetical protein